LHAARREDRTSGAPIDRCSERNDSEFFEFTALLAAVLLGMLLIVLA